MLAARHKYMIIYHGHVTLACKSIAICSSMSALCKGPMHFLAWVACMLSAMHKYIPKWSTVTEAVAQGKNKGIYKTVHNCSLNLC